MTTKAKSFLGLLVAAGAFSAVYTYLSTPKKSVPNKHHDSAKKAPEHKKKSTVLNCEIGLACDAIGRRCPGYEKCGERVSCSYGLTDEMVCEVHADEEDNVDETLTEESTAEQTTDPDPATETLSGDDETQAEESTVVD